MTREDRRTQKTPPMGTSLFMAPEVESRDVYGQQSDMWALGVIVYFFVGGRMPFEHSVSGLYKVLMGQYEPFDKCFSDQAKDVSGQVFGVRRNEIYLFSQPRPIRSVHAGEGWTPSSCIDRALPALSPSFHKLERSSDVFSWDPV